MTRGRVSLWLAIALACLAFVLSLCGAPKVWLHTGGGLHTWYHVGLFATLGLLAMRSTASGWKRCVLLAAVALLGYGIEYKEAARYDWPIEWYDVRSDFLGAAVGSVMGWWVERRSVRIR